MISYYIITNLYIYHNTNNSIFDKIWDMLYYYNIIIIKSGQLLFDNRHRFVKIWRECGGEKSKE